MALTQVEFEQIIDDLRNDKIVELDLNHQNLDTNQAIAIADALRTNSSLSKIYLSFNKIDNEGVKEIAETLKVNNILALDTIHFGNNLIGDEGAIAIADLLTTNKTITSIDLSWNRIGEEGAEAIYEALGHNNIVTSIYLSRNQIANKLHSKIKGLIKENCKLRDDFLDLVKKAITDDSHLENLEASMREDVTPLAHQSYALVRIIEEVAELSEKGQDITQHLKMIEFLMVNTALVSKKVLDAVKSTNNPQISDLQRKALKMREEVDLDALITLQVGEKEDDLEKIGLQESQPLSEGDILTLIEGSVKKRKLKPKRPTKSPLSKIQQVTEAAHSSSVVQLPESAEVLEHKIRQEEIAKQEKAYDEIAHLQERVENFDSLQSSSASGTLTVQQSAELNEVQNRIRSLEVELGRVDERYKLSEQELLEKRHIKENLDLKICSDLIENAFNVAFHVAINMSSQEFETQERNVSQVLESASTLVSGIPVVTPVVLLALAGISTVTKASRSGQFKAISDLNPRAKISESERFAENMAHVLTISSESEIINLARGINDEETRLERIKSSFSEAAKSFKNSAKAAVANVSSPTARGLLGEDYLPMQLLALDIADKAISYIMNQTIEELKQTQEEVSAGNYEALMERIVEKTIGKKLVRLSVISKEVQEPNFCASQEVCNVVMKKEDEISDLSMISELEKSYSKKIEKIEEQIKKLLDEKEKRKEFSKEEESKKKIEGLGRQLSRAGTELQVVVEKTATEQLIDLLNGEGDLSLNKMRELMADGADVANYLDEDGRSVLDIAMSTHHNLNIIIELIENGAKITNHTDASSISSIRDVETREILEKQLEEINKQETDQSPQTTVENPNSSTLQGRTPDGCCTIS